MEVGIGISATCIKELLNVHASLLGQVHRLMGRTSIWLNFGQLSVYITKLVCIIDETSSFYILISTKYSYSHPEFSISDPKSN